MHVLVSEAVRAASRPAIRGLIRLSQEVVRGQVNRIVLEDDASDLPTLGALLRRRRLEAFPEAMTQLIEILAQSLAAETVAARPRRSSM